MTDIDRSPPIPTLTEVLGLILWTNETIDLAEQGDRFDKTGHAQHAKDLLQQAKVAIIDALDALGQ